MTPIRQWIAFGAIIIIGNALQWLGFPFTIHALWRADTVAGPSVAIWTAGLMSVLAPYADWRVRWIRHVVVGGAAAVAYLLALPVVAFCTPPITTVVDPIVGFVLAIWSLTGGIALLVTAFSPLLPTISRVTSVHPEDAVARPRRSVPLRPGRI